MLILISDHNLAKLLINLLFQAIALLHFYSVELGGSGIIIHFIFHDQFHQVLVYKSHSMVDIALLFLVYFSERISRHPTPRIIIQLNHIVDFVLLRYWIVE